MKKKRYVLKLAALCAAIGMVLTGCGNDAVPDGEAAADSEKAEMVTRITVEAVAEYPVEPEFKDDDQR